MKVTKYFLFIYFISTASLLLSQNGLENIIVERYYISDHNDTVASARAGKLPVGSVTYRIFLDMLPGYRFQAAYGNNDHELRIETTAKFFNNEDIGSKIANVIPRRSLSRNTVMLDSWLSAGGAGEDIYGILKSDDDSIETIIHEGNFLQNKDKKAGIPLAKRDGLLNGVNVPFPVLFGIDSLVKVFYNSTRGSLFSTTNGAWGCLGGSVGPDSLNTNRVLIAQLTTDGELSFELNIQIGKRNASPENYVAKNPIGNEILFPALTYSSKEVAVSSFQRKKLTQKKAEQNQTNNQQKKL